MRLVDVSVVASHRIAPRKRLCLRSVLGSWDERDFVRGAEEHHEQEEEWPTIHGLMWAEVVMPIQVILKDAKTFTERTRPVERSSSSVTFVEGFALSLVGRGDASRRHVQSSDPCCDFSSE